MTIKNTINILAVSGVSEMVAGFVGALWCSIVPMRKKYWLLMLIGGILGLLPKLCLPYLDDSVAFMDTEIITKVFITSAAIGVAGGLVCLVKRAQLNFENE